MGKLKHQIVFKNAYSFHDGNNNNYGYVHNVVNNGVFIYNYLSEISIGNGTYRSIGFLFYKI